MKGTPAVPAMRLLRDRRPDPRRARLPFKTVNVLADPEIRDGIKDFSNWPTIPQLYVNGEFVGGCDIVREMYQTGELQQLLKEKGVALSEAA